MLPFTEVRKNEFREKIEELVFEYAFWTSIRQLDNRILEFGGKAVGCRYKFECYLHMKTLSLKLDTIKGVRVDGEEIGLGAQQC